MSVRSLESAICAKLRQLTNNPKLRVKDITEWSTGVIKEHPHETVFHIPDIGVYAAVKLSDCKGVPGNTDLSASAGFIKKMGDLTK